MRKIVNRINSVFNHKKLRTLISGFRYPICLMLLVTLHPHIKHSLLLQGFIVSLLGELIQVWSFASLYKNKSLAVKGLYSLTRNPMYIGRFFLLLGLVLLLDEIWIIPVFLMLYYFYMINRVKREETVLHEIFREEYKSYCSMVNRFVPSFKQVQLKSLAFFRWKLFFQNHGHWNFIGFLSIYLFFYLFTIHKG